MKTWDVYLVRTASFQGIAYVAVGGDGHVKHAVLSGSTSSGEGALSLVNYDEAGKTGATERDAVVLHALATDLDAVNAAAQIATLQRQVDAARRALDATSKQADAYGKAADAYREAAGAHQRASEAFSCSADLFTLSGGIVAAMALPTVALIVGAPLAAVGGAIAVLVSALSVAGVGVVSFTVTEMVMSAIDKTRCFAR